VTAGHDLEPRTRLFLLGFIVVGVRDGNRSNQIRGSTEVRPEIFGARSNRSQLVQILKVRPNRIGLELRYISPDRSGPLDPTDIPENCYRRSVAGEVAYCIQLSLFL
jgi:hypothetical protein